MPFSILAAEKRVKEDQIFNKINLLIIKHHLFFISFIEVKKAKTQDRNP